MSVWIKNNKEVLLYLFFGGLTTLVNLSVYSICRINFKIDYQISVIISWLISVLFAYITNKYFVFKMRDSMYKSLLREVFLFYFYRIISLFLEMAILFIFFNFLKINEVVVKTGAQVIVVMANYLFSKYIIFINKK